MNTKQSSGASGWVDPDDAPALTPEFFAQAEIKQGERVIRRGRPKLGFAAPIPLDRAMTARRKE